MLDRNTFHNYLQAKVELFTLRTTRIHNETFHALINVMLLNLKEKPTEHPHNLL